MKNELIFLDREKVHGDKKTTLGLAGGLRQQTMDFAGITGSLVYRGDLAPFAGLLAFGEITQLGGKTTFGFGRIHTRFSFED